MSTTAGPSSSSSYAAPSILNIHTPTSSFSIPHSLTQDSLETLYDKLSRKRNTDFEGKRVGPGWLKYEFGESVWNLDDGLSLFLREYLRSTHSDYTIFVWRQHEHHEATPTLHLRVPGEPLPSGDSTTTTNPSFHLFKPLPPSSDRASQSSVARSSRSRNTLGSKRSKAAAKSKAPTFKQEFERFHSENGVRTVLGTFGHVKHVRMLLKSGYRHVYISHSFALKHGFVSKDIMLGHGYSGLVSIGKWEVGLDLADPPNENEKAGKVVEMMVYLSEEPHFDIVLGRAFFEKRQIKTDPIDLTNVVCLDVGEKVLCELVILKDGKGEFVTVT